ncbi:MAG: hypothetical protein F6K58_11560 [Symploca sp. SIO2E9]|nr:hypothetical protein [Symploca sp. SIO2E9]
MVGFIIVSIILTWVRSNAAIGIITALGISASVLSYKYPRQALWAFLIYMPFSGTITYWLAGGNSLFEFAQDVFYFGFGASFYRSIVSSNRESREF